MTRRWRWSRNAGSGGADSDRWMLVFSQPPSWREDVSGRWIADYGWSLTISVSPGRCHETGLRARHGRRARAAPDGTLTWGVHVTLAARWLDPSDTEAFITPFMVLYALHDALVKPMPGGDNTPSLAESWTVSKDGITYEFVLRKGVKFHNGDPVTA